jgi:hypothetical protein
MPSVRHEHACVERRFLASAPRVIGWSGRLRGVLTYTRRLGRYGASAAGLCLPVRRARAPALRVRTPTSGEENERGAACLFLVQRSPCLSSSTPPARGTRRPSAPTPSCRPGVWIAMQARAVVTACSPMDVFDRLTAKV